MNVKVAVVLVVVLVVAAVLVLFYGAVRPAGSLDASEDGVEGGLGWLVTGEDVTFDDVSDASCADPVARRLVVAPGGSCATALPDSGSLTMCLTAGGLAVVTIDGSQFPKQELTDDGLACGAPQSLDLYDEQSTLELACPGQLTCEFEVLPRP